MTEGPIVIVSPAVASSNNGNWHTASRWRTFLSAVRSRVPVLASKIDGNIGLLGHDYEGYFAAGDPLQLAQLVRRMQGEPAFANRLRVQCGLREPLFAPSVEAAAVLALWSDMQSFCTGE